MSQEQKTFFCKNIKVIDQEGIELIFAILRIYQMNNNNVDTSLYTIPYGGKRLKQGIKFDLDDLPFKLKQMIYEFLCMHLKKIKEDAERNSTRQTFLTSK